ncbi:MAG: FtsQ-type POTRA domain-containing protein [Propionibacteriaceae bacterium]|jgi:cell division protein FtsQ|nr:FtsQ-type POTRA domain-containing protein [Propionibacteriaceae bacterium]
MAKPTPRPRWKRIVRRVLITLSYVVVIAGAVAAVYLVRFSSLFPATNIEVQGLNTLTADAVITAAAIEPETPLAAVDVEQVARSVSGLRAVESVTVARNWPTSLLLEITERTPAIAVKLGTKYMLADANGITYTTVDKKPSLPIVLAGPEEQQIIADSLAAYQALSAGVAKKVTEIQANSIDSIVFVFKDGDKVMFGSVEQAELKSQVLDQLLKKKGKTYDVSAPAYPTVK